MKKSTLVAVAVFLALAVGVVLSMTRKSERGVTRVSFKDVDHALITRVEVTGKNEVVLEKDGDAWRVGKNGKLADPNMVKRMVEAIPTIATTDLVTRSSERYAELEVDEEKGARIKAFAGSEKVADFWVGKSAKGGSYLRVGDAVYVASRLYASTFSRQASQWLQRKLFEDKLADVTKVEVKLAGKPAYTLVKKDNTWDLEDASILPKGFRFDKNQARSLVSTVVNARAKDILDVDPGADKTGLSADADLIAFDVEQGEGDAKTTVRRELRIGKTDDENKSVYAQVGGKADVVTLAEYTAKNIRKAATDFRDMRFMEVANNKITKVRIVDGKMRLTLEKQGADWKFGKTSEKIPADFELDPAMVTRRLAAIGSARAAKVVEGMSLAAAGLTRPAATVTVTLEDKSTATLAFGKSIKDDKRDMFYARGNVDGAVYLVTKWTRDNVTGGIKTFKKRADPSGFGGLDPKALSGLPPDVRAGLMKQIEQKKQQQQMIERLQKQAAKRSKAP